ncbi:dihydrolipoamide acetyltransferase component of pyruvate dehydrogenase complex [Armatimonadota bacterium]|nr:dihydrolipoamide acetyltransferase component of pyruvate dehydrogenase complex [Armatimonadota bacterium]
MAQIFTMPQLGSTMEEGTILKWHKQEGDTVKSGEILLEIETDKASMEVESPVDGVLRKVLAKENDLLPIRQPIAILGSAEESIDALLTEALGGVPAEEARALAPISEAPPPAIQASPPASSTSVKVFLSPRASRLAEEHGVSHAELSGRGTGPQGRVIERDVLAYAEARKAQPTEKASPRATPLAARVADDLGVDIGELMLGLPGSRVRRDDVVRYAESRQPVPVPPVTPAQEDVTIQPFAGMRRRIADNVAKSRFTAPHVTLTIEVDMTATAEFRQRILPEVEKVYGVRVSFTDIIIKAVARALDEHPMMNSALVGEEIRIYAHKNIGVAVALEVGLVVPVLKRAEEKSIGAIAQEAKPLIDRVRGGKFTPDDLAGGTFTITNLGTFGIDNFDPIIVPPQAAILGVCRIVDKPVVVNKAIVIRSMMNLCLSFDHRIVDGAPAARFLQRLKELLENPLLILI